MTQVPPQTSRFALQRIPVDTLELIYDLELLTPMVGGGAIPRKIDAQQPVNAKSIRGHLRFWWRATRAGRYGAGGLEAMRRDEAWLFGTAAKFEKPTGSEEKDAEKSPLLKAPVLGSSRVQVEVLNIQCGQPETYANHPDDRYVGFPLAAIPNQGVKAAQILKKLTFTLKLTVRKAHLASQGWQSEAEIKKDLEAAIWAWTTFGGLGARTRRGFGALMIKGRSPTKQEILTALKGYVLTGEAPAGVSQLSLNKDDMLVADGYEKAQDAWYDVIEFYKDFRQFRRYVNGAPKRSYWPEADTMRSLPNVGPGAVIHRTPNTSVRKFPRAAFGLPIPFQFRAVPNDAPEPRKTTLEATHTDRWASPLLFRPVSQDVLIITILCCADHPQHPLKHLKLKSSTAPIDHQLTAGDVSALKAQNLPHHKIHVPFKINVPRSFLDYVQERLK